MRVGLAAFALILTCLLLELGVRVLHPVPLHATDTYLAREAKRAKAGTLVLVPNARARDVSGEFDVEVRVNSHGLRDREFDFRKPPGTYRVLVLGDSQTFGVGVEAAETYAKVLERQLRETTGRPVEVLNTGVPGTGTAHQLYFLERQGWRYAPDAVVLGFFFNDVNNNRLCDLYALKEGRLVRNARTDLDNTDEPWRRSEGSPGLFAVHTADRQVEPPATSFWVRHSHLVRFVRARLSAVVHREAAEVRQAQEGDNAAARELTAHLLGELSQQCRERKTTFVAAMIPSLVQCRHRTAAAVQAANAPLLGRLDPSREVLDLLPLFHARGGERLFFPADQHMNRHGHLATGEAVAQKLLEADPRLRRAAEAVTRRP